MEETCSAKSRCGSIEVDGRYDVFGRPFVNTAKSANGQ